MVRRLIACFLLVVCPWAAAEQEHEAAMPTRFAVGQQFVGDESTYRLFVVRPAAAGVSIDRITLTTPSDSCFNHARLSGDSARVDAGIADLLDGLNPCSLSDETLRHEEKIEPPLFRGTELVLQALCGSTVRRIPADVLDRQTLAARTLKPNEPLSWTMRLHDRLNAAVPDRVATNERSLLGNVAPSMSVDAETTKALAAGEYDGLLAGVKTNVSLPVSTVDLVSATVQPKTFVSPQYPLAARLARLEGRIAARVDLDRNGTVVNTTVTRAIPLLDEAVIEASKSWVFPKKAAHRQPEVVVEFRSNCPAP